MAEVSIDQAIALAVQHHQAGRLREAEAIYRQILSQNPNDPNALNVLGVIRAQSEDLATALELITRAIAINPNVASFHLNLGRVLVRLHRLDDAIASLQRSQSIDPENANILTNLGTALHAHGQLDSAEQCFCKALSLRPNDAGSHSNLVITLLAKGHTDEAIASYHAALAIKPDYAEVHTNLGNALMLKREVEQGLSSYRRAAQLAPQLPMVRYNLSQALLLTGDFEQGWQEYEWRTRAKELKLNLVEFSPPLWDGSELNGQRIFLQAEQGFGDFIQFVRYAPLVAARGGRVFLSCLDALVELARTVPGVEQIIRHGETVPDFDVHCPLASLPFRFNTTLQTIPASVPYLHADPHRAEQWKNSMEAIEAKKRIGLVWAGRSNHRNDRHRSMRLHHMLPLAEIDNAVFFSLQKGDPADQAKSPSPGLRLIDWTDELHTFSDTAALIANLDLIITVDTAVAHLAGALAKPVWVLLPFNGEWRWLLDRTDSPWYPTMRLFRQTALDDWTTPLRQIIEALST